MADPPHALKIVAWVFTRPIRSGPTTRGFVYYFSTDVPNSPPFIFIENSRVLAPPIDALRLDDSQGVVLPRGFAGSPTALGWRFDDILPELTRRAGSACRSSRAGPDTSRPIRAARSSWAVDAFATLAVLVAKPLPSAAAEDSLSFRPALLGRTPSPAGRTTLVNHSNYREFAYAMAHGSSFSASRACCRNPAAR